MKKFFVIFFSLLILLTPLSSSVFAGSILLTQFDISIGYLDMQTNLENLGHTVDIVDATTSGNVAAALSSGTYDQLFLWDLTSSNYLNSADITAELR